MSRTSTDSLSRRKARRDHAELPAGRAEVERTLEALRLVPSKRLGQSFLSDAFVADAEAALLTPRAGAPIVEVGGGLGILTEALLRRGLGPITVIERDARLATYLRGKFGNRVTIVEADALTTELPPDAVYVGNLPFSIATSLLVRLLYARVPQVVALIQREVAERLAAGPGSRVYGRLSILAQAFGSVELFQIVPADSFTPTPAVDGRIVALTARTGPLPVASIDRLESVVRTLFSARRKQLGNLLPRVAHLPADPDSVASQAGWPVDWAHLRPENLPPAAFFRLANLVVEARSLRARPST
ncbi:MAG: 16S rRNA (adenine(1518)-N(6)/adenine(1519)-N(6))-dimethyltransferase RsmA [Thermoplasmata archaeon]